jgi:hypothetical protein
VQGRDFLAADYAPRKLLFAGRDRCDETVDILRCVRDSRYKYIRNFMSHVAHAQPSQYKDGKSIVKTMRQLHTDGKLNANQSKPFVAPRPPEEFYDLENDPHELNNLAGDPKHAERLKAMREATYSKMVAIRDMGLVPEPILEDVGRAAGGKYKAFQATNPADQTRRLIDVITAGEAGDTKALAKFAESADPSTRYWAAVWLGVNEAANAKPVLEKLAADETPAVRIAAAQALVKLGDRKRLKDLVGLINDENLLTGMFALRAIEELGDAGKAYKTEVAAAQKSKYEFSRRIARRLTGKWK